MIAAATAASATASASAPAGQRQRGRRRRTVPRGACSSRAPCAAPPQSGQRRPGERYYHELPGPPPQSCSSGSGWRHSQGTPSPPPRPLFFRLDLLFHLFLFFLHLLFLRSPLPRRGSWPLLSRPRMPGGKRGLVAPQNTFLENIVRRSSGKKSCSQNTPPPPSCAPTPPILPVPSLSQGGRGTQTALPGGCSYKMDLILGGSGNEVAEES